MENIINRGYITIDIMHPFFNPTQSYEKINCFISIIDTEGKETFTQSGEFNLKFKDDVKSFLGFLSQETMLSNSFELLDSNDLIFCVNLQFESVLRNSFELLPNNHITILRNLEFHKNSNIDSVDNEICLFEKYPYTRALLSNTAWKMRM